MPFFGIDFGLLTTIFWVWMLVDCLFNPRARGGNKVFWFLFILFTQFFGAIVYFFIKCSMRNPIEAIPYYLRTLKQAVEPTMQTPPYQYQPRSYSQPRSQPSQPAQSAPMAQPASYEDYAQGYRYQPPTPVGQVQPYEGTTGTPEPQYEETMISYPEMEMPPQQM